MEVNTRDIRPDSFVFYRSFLDAIDQASDVEQLALYRGIVLYALNGVEPEFDGLLQAVWLMIRPRLDANRRRYVDGCRGGVHGKKGGRPKNPTKTPCKPQENPTKTPCADDAKRGAKRATRFVVPTLQEVRDYVTEKSLSVDAERFYNYYSSNGWMVGRNKMRDWRAALQNWSRSNYPSPATSTSQAEVAKVGDDDKDYSERF